MCYYDRTHWRCGYWQWSHFREQCPKKCRTEEPCELQLIFEINPESDICKLCKDIEKKQRKYSKLEGDIRRWHREGNSRRTIERAQGDMAEASNAIKSMQQQHWTRVNSTTGAEGDSPRSVSPNHSFAPSTSLERAQSDMAEASNAMESMQQQHRTPERYVIDMEECSPPLSPDPSFALTYGRQIPTLPATSEATSIAYNSNEEDPAATYSSSAVPYVSGQNSELPYFPENGSPTHSNVIIPGPAWIDCPPREHYTVAILCALPKELKAVRMMFDQWYEVPDIALEDTNSYAFGRIGDHDVVTAVLPSATYGTNAAAGVAVNLRRSFLSIRFCLLVGIGGGVPSPQHDIRLGDIVVGEPVGSLPGVIQYDLGKSLQGGRFQITGSLDRPPNVLLTAISNLKSDPRLPESPLTPTLDIMARLDSKYGHPGQSRDNPFVHYGTIASGNRVIKSAEDRDRLARDYDILCFEMEAAGIVNTFPCLVIRGICDYADSSKNKTWQEYAAATAAAYAKLLLGYVRASSRIKASMNSDKHKHRSYNSG